MPCKGGGLSANCQEAVVCYIKVFGGRRSERCAIHSQDPTGKYYSLEDDSLLPPPVPADLSQAPSGWGNLPAIPAETLFESKFFKVSRIASEHWYVEDMIYPGRTTLVGSGNPFEPLLKKLSSAKSLSMRSCVMETLGWNRDPVLRTLDGPSLFKERELAANTDFAMPKSYDGIVGDATNILGSVRSPPDISFGPLTRTTDDTYYGIHHEPVAGGNVITARNKLGQLRFIVGEMAVLSVFKLCNLKSAAAAKIRITSLLLGDVVESESVRVVFVPQWAYHVDLQLLYLAPGKIAMHAFQKQHDIVNAFLWKPKDAGQRKILHGKIAGLAKRFGTLQKELQETLEAEGFDIVPVCGVFPTVVRDGHIQNGLGSDRDWYFCFLNGIALHPNKVLVVHNDDTKMQFVEMAFECFREALSGADVQAIAVGNHLRSGFDEVNQYGFTQEGGLRCRSTTLPLGYSKLP